MTNQPDLPNLPRTSPPSPAPADIPYQIAISNSEIATFQRCQRKWYLQYYLGVQPADPEITGVRIQGSRIHTAMEGWYGYGLDPLAVLGILYKQELDRHPEAAAELEAERDLSSAMVEGYVEWVTAEGVDADLRVVATEADVTVPLPGVEGVGLRAKLDQVVLHESTGLLSYLDFKNSGTFEKHEYLELDPQFRFYCLIQRLARAEDAPQVDGGIVSTLRRVKRTERSRPPYYQRDSFRYSPEVLESTLLKTAGVARKIVAARASLDWAYTHGQGDLELVNALQWHTLPPTPIISDCKWSCPFVNGLCMAMDDGSDWPGIVERSGRYVQGDPYSYYSDDALRSVRAELEKL